MSSLLLFTNYVSPLLLVQKKIPNDICDPPVSKHVYSRMLIIQSKWDQGQSDDQACWIIRDACKNCEENAVCRSMKKSQTKIVFDIIYTS
jgi:hypothetical protein